MITLCAETAGLQLDAILQNFVKFQDRNKRFCEKCCSNACDYDVILQCSLESGPLRRHVVANKKVNRKQT